jgi:hypothetical protein
MMASGIATVFLWPRYGLDAHVFELLPAMVVPAVVYVAGAAIDRVRFPA